MRIATHLFESTEVEGCLLGLTLEQRAVYRRHVEVFNAGGWTACGWYAVITQALKEAGCNERAVLVLGRVIDDVELEGEGLV
ncbi:MAG: hypothetical protein ACFBSF_16260 [Leptolyngbyaceae cyanobacterium]